jgi:hypothetical protein
LAGVDVSTLDLLLSVLAEKNHDINSKNEVYNSTVPPIHVVLICLLCAQCGQTPLHVACASLRSPAESAALVSHYQGADLHIPIVLWHLSVYVLIILLMLLFQEINVEQRLKIEHLLSHKASHWIKDKVREVDQ